MIILDSEKLREARKEKNLTQEKLSEIADLSDRHLRNLESGRSTTSATMLYKLSMALGKNMEEFIIDGKKNCDEE